MQCVRVSRLAPSPSGPLHLGNASTFLVNWALARREGWRLLLRVEDLDRPRVREGAEEEILRSLDWIGIDHDGEVDRQSSRGVAYQRALEALAAQQLVFESRHSRAEVRAAADVALRGRGTSRGNSRQSHSGSDDERDAASAPHGVGSAFPRSLRPSSPESWRFEDHGVNHRLRIPDGAINFDDQVMGSQRVDLGREMGDFIVWSKAGVASYQLAVSVDDGEQGVTDVVRGADLLPSAAAQSIIHAALGRPAPRWWHLPVVVDGDGRRLSKRDGDLSLEALRHRGVDPRRVIGLVGWWTGFTESLRPLDAAEFRDACEPSKLRSWSTSPPPRLDADALEWLAA